MSDAGFLKASPPDRRRIVVHSGKSGWHDFHFQEVQVFGEGTFELQAMLDNTTFQVSDVGVEGCQLENGTIAVTSQNENIVTINNQNENGDLFMNYFAHLFIAMCFILDPLILKRYHAGLVIVPSLDTDTG